MSPLNRPLPPWLPRCVLLLIAGFVLTILLIVHESRSPKLTAAQATANAQAERFAKIAQHNQTRSPAPPSQPTITHEQVRQTLEALTEQKRATVYTAPVTMRDFSYRGPIKTATTLGDGYARQFLNVPVTFAACTKVGDEETIADGKYVRLQGTYEPFKPWSAEVAVKVREGDGERLILIKLASIIVGENETSFRVHDVIEGSKP